VTRGKTDNAAYIIEVLTCFLRVLKEKIPATSAGNWWFYWDNAPVHTATMVTNLMVARWSQVIQYLPYSPDLVLADFFLFLRLKRELDSKTLIQEALRKEWDRSIRTLLAEDFTMSLQAVVRAPQKVREDHWQLCRGTLKIKNVPAITVFFWGLPSLK
jgi:hypothetical protein